MTSGAQKCRLQVFSPTGPSTANCTSEFTSLFARP